MCTKCCNSHLFTEPYHTCTALPLCLGTGHAFAPLILPSSIPFLARVHLLVRWQWVHSVTVQGFAFVHSEVTTSLCQLRTFSAGTSGTVTGNTRVPLFIHYEIHDGIASFWCKLLVINQTEFPLILAPQKVVEEGEPYHIIPSEGNGADACNPFPISPRSTKLSVRIGHKNSAWCEWQVSMGPSPSPKVDSPTPLPFVLQFGAPQGAPAKLVVPGQLTVIVGQTMAVSANRS